MLKTLILWKSSFVCQAWDSPIWYLLVLKLFLPGLYYHHIYNMHNLYFEKILIWAALFKSCHHFDFDIEKFYRYENNILLAEVFNVMNMPGDFTRKFPSNLESFAVFFLDFHSNFFCILFVFEANLFHYFNNILLLCLSIWFQNTRSINL